MSIINALGYYLMCVNKTNKKQKNNNNNKIEIIPEYQGIFVCFDSIE